MLVVLAPTLRRMLIELALGRDAGRVGRAASWLPAPPDTMADRASDLLAAAAALGYLRRPAPSMRPRPSGSPGGSRAWSPP
jgi:hypothetical protein